MRSPGAELIATCMKRQWKNVARGAALFMGHQTGEALVPVAIGIFIDRAVSTGNYSELIPGVIMLAVVFAGLSNSWRFGAGFVLRAFRGTEHDLRMAIVKRILDPAGGAGRRMTGEVLNIATVDAQRVGRIAEVIARSAAAFAALAVTTIVLLRISIPLGLLVILGSIPLLALIQLLGRTLERHSGAEQAGAARAAGIANDLVSGLRVLKGIGAEDAAIERYRVASRHSLDATKRAARTQSLYEGLNLALTGAFLALVAFVGGRLAANGTISVGDLIAALGLSQFLIGPMQRLTSVGAQLARGRASAARVASLLAEPSRFTEAASHSPEQVAGRLRFESVTAGPLHDVSFEVEPGEMIGVAIAEPAEALALLDILDGSTEPLMGRVLLDGRDIDSLLPESRHAAVLVAPHDSYLFAETVLENVRAPSSEEDVLWAIEAAAADEVAENLPRGLDTPLSEGGRSLSGGQRQRVSLARALAASPPVLVLHDPTTAVDSVTESRIAAAVRRTRGGKTTLIVTTSPALLAVTDRVVFLSDGAVRSVAPHSELMEARPDYQEMVVS